MQGVASSTSSARVSHRGQTTLPAALRKLWGIEDGGEVGVLDLGDAALIIPGGESAAKAELARVLKDSYDDGLDQIDDPDLQDQ